MTEDDVSETITGREFVEMGPEAEVFATLSYVNHDGVTWTEQGVVHRARVEWADGWPRFSRKPEAAAADD